MISTGLGSIADNGSGGNYAPHLEITLTGGSVVTLYVVGTVRVCDAAPPTRRRLRLTW